MKISRSTGDLVRKATGVANAAQLGYLEGEVIGTLCLGVMGFAFLSVPILGAPWSVFGYSILFTICVFVFLFFRALACWILVGLEILKRKE